MKTIHSSISVTIIFTATLFFLVMCSCQRKGTKKDTDLSISNTTSDTAMQKKDTSTTAPAKEEMTEVKTENKPEGKPGTSTQEQSEPTVPLTPNTRTEDIRIDATGKICLDEQELSLKLTLLSEKMEKDSLMYDNKNAARLQDCSGIFHQIAKKVSTWCEEYQYPLPNEVRDSRSIAGWYHRKNTLIIIEDPLAQRNLIRPGSVMFFGQSGKKYENLIPEMLYAKSDYSQQGIVGHIGIVTEVKKDTNGDVESYVMMHGRRPGVTAQRSHYHSIKPPRFGYPILGNWEQQWVGISNINVPL